MIRPKEIITSLRLPLIAFGLVPILFLLAPDMHAQDKRPINNKGQIRQTRAKSVKRKEKATTRDIAGKKLRTRNKSTAQRAIYTAQSPYKNKRKSGDKVGRPVGGSTPRIRSRSAEMARSNVYPQRGPFVNNSSKRPVKAFSNKRELSRLARLQTGPEPPGRKKRVTPRSASRAYVTRGRINPYWGKYSKGERAITTDIAGRPLRTKNFRSAANPLIEAVNPYRGRKDRGDRAYKGTSRSGFATATRRGELPWKGDLAGQPIRKSKGRDNQVAGKPGSAPKISPGFSARIIRKDVSYTRGIKGKRGGGSVTGKYKSNKPISARAPTAVASYMRKDLNKLPGVKPATGGGSVTGKYKSNKPIGARAPTAVASYMRKDLNKLRGVKPATGGGSVTGKYKSNKPISARAPTVVASYMRKDLKKLRGVKPATGGGGSISARMKRSTGVSLAGKPPANPGVAAKMGNYSGNIPSMRPPKRGGSITARLKRNNNGQPVPVRQPLDQRAASYQADYKGFFKRSSPLKGGGSVSGSWNNSNRPIPGKVARQLPERVSKVELSLRQQAKAYNKPKKPLKGGGSISGSWNNNNRPIPGKVARLLPERVSKVELSLRQQAKAYNKPKKPLKGGGSVSGSWNNNNRPIPGKVARQLPDRVSKVEVSLRQQAKAYNKSKKPLKGGGSISGKLFNNNGKPLPVKLPTGSQAKEIDYSGKIRLSGLKREYVRNPNAAEQALKKQSPNETVYKLNGLIVGVKQKDASKKPNAVKGAMPGVGPSRATVKASEYARGIKVIWQYKHNPSSADAAQKIKYSKSFKRVTEFAGKTRLTKEYRHNPNSNKEALKVIAPGRAYARIDDYQGNIKMNKFNHKKHFPGAGYAHGNVKVERTIITDVKLLWSKLFRKNSIQPDAVKDKVRRPRYDKKEKELWKDLYD